MKNALRIGTRYLMSTLFCVVVIFPCTEVRWIVAGSVDRMGVSGTDVLSTEQYYRALVLAALAVCFLLPVVIPQLGRNASTVRRLIAGGMVGAGLATVAFIVTRLSTGVSHDPVGPTWLVLSGFLAGSFLPAVKESDWSRQLSEIQTRQVLLLFWLILMSAASCVTPVHGGGYRETVGRELSSRVFILLVAVAVLRLLRNQFQSRRLALLILTSITAGALTQWLSFALLFVVGVFSFGRFGIDYALRAYLGYPWLFLVWALMACSYITYQRSRISKQSAG